MLKRLSIFCCFSILLVVAACAPGRREVVVRPPEIKERLTVDEIRNIAGKDIDSMKAIADIKIKRDSSPYDFVNVSVLLMKPNRLHIRAYKFGALVRDIIVNDGDVTVLSGKKGAWMSDMASELYNAVFWWEGIESARMQYLGDDIVILTDRKQLLLDRNSLQPRSQQIKTESGNFSLMYGSPRMFGDYIYPDKMKIYMGRFLFDVRIKKLKINPGITEADFRVSR
jgi:hypothetical protein